MASRDPLARLRHIDFHIVGIMKTLNGTSFDDFVSTYHLERTAERELSIVSETAKLLPQELLDAYPDVPWAAIIGIGNLLRHEYEKIDSAIIWDIVQNHLPKMHGTITQMIADLSGGHGNTAS
jgi:uncharacterized protein with HEPN domain